MLIHLFIVTINIPYGCVSFPTYSVISPGKKKEKRKRKLHKSDLTLEQPVDLKLKAGSSGVNNSDL